MNLHPTERSWLIPAILVLVVASVSGQTVASNEPPKEEIIVLSAFTVTSESDRGYRATNTLAGTRLKTSLRDVGAAVSVLTPELFRDTGATDSASILSYALNTETSGTLGNFAGGDAAFTDAKGVSLQNSRVSPQSGQRVRGLAQASLTRNYFETDIAFDTYNTDSVTINRGPNSLLFGIGSPGGIIEGSLKEARLNRDSGEISFRVGQRDSYRGTFDYNKVIIKDRLALRIAGLSEDTQYKQRPAYLSQDRIYGALKAVVLENKKSNIVGSTTIRANYEQGRDRGTPPNVTPPGDGLSSWFSPPDTSNAFNATTNSTGTTGPFPAWTTDGSFVPKYTVDPRGLNSSGVPLGVNVNTVKGAVAIPLFIQMALYYTDSNAAPFIPGTNLNGALSRTSYNFGGRPRQTWDFFVNASYYSRNYFPGYTVASLPTRVFDNENMLLAGTTNRVTHDFDAHSVVLEQSLFKGKAGFEFAYDKQSYSTWFRLPFTGGSNSAQNNYGDVVIDVQQYLSNDQPNPNVGRMMVSIDSTVGISLAGHQEAESEREAKRFTAFADLDFRNREGMLKWLGRHVVTGLYSQQERTTLNKGIGANWTSSTINLLSNDFHFVGAEGVRNTRLQMRAQVYLEPSLLDPKVRSINDIHINNYIDIPIPKAGEVYRMYTYNRVTNTIVPGDFTLQNSLYSADLNRREIDTKAISMQSHLLKDHLVGLVGWREDEQVNTPQAGTFYLADGSVDTAQSLAWGAANPAEVGRTFSWSLVGHTPKFLARYMPGFTVSPHYNSSENFNPVGSRSSILGAPLTSPTGSTKEYGFTVNLLDDRVSLRFNWYKTQIKNDTADIGGFARNPQFIITDWMRRLKDSENAGITIQQAIVIAKGQPGVFTSYQDAYDKIVALAPAEVRDVYRFRIEGPNVIDDRVNVSNPTATRAFVSRGIELDAVASLTKNWRLFMNVAKQETVQSDIGIEQLALANTIRDNLSKTAFKDMFDSPALGEANTYTARFNNSLYIPLLAATIKDGAVALEQRKWRVNVGSNYEVSTGRLKGVGIGGAIRWQDKAATGYPLVANSLGVAVPDLNRPFWGPSTWNGDVWVSYHRKVFRDKINWSIQLNVRNAIGDDDIIPVATNPDGRLAVFRNPNPREVFLTNTFRF
jgi:outer membrane receptor protein involved in Fe transport